MAADSSAVRIARHRQINGRIKQGDIRLDLSISGETKEVLKQLVRYHGVTQRDLLERLLNQDLQAIESLPRGNNLADLSVYATPNLLPRGNVTEVMKTEILYYIVDVSQGIEPKDARDYIANRWFDENYQLALDCIRLLPSRSGYQPNRCSTQIGKIIGRIEASFVNYLKNFKKNELRQADRMRVLLKPQGQT